MAWPSTDIIVTPFLVVAASLSYYKLVSGFLSDVTIRRLTKTSLDITVIGFLDLFFGYTFGIMAFIIIYFYKITLDPTFKIDQIIFIATGFSLLYLGRILTKQQGSIFGKLHFSSLFITVFVIILVQIVSSSNLTYNSIYDNIQKFISLFVENKTEIFMGSLILSLFGESLLSCLPPTPKSLLAIADKFPSDLRVVCGIHPQIKYKLKLLGQVVANGNKDSIQKLNNSSAIYAKIDEIFDNPSVEEIKCVTKSLVLAENILDHIEDQHKKGKTINFKILKSPKQNAFNDFEIAIKRRPLSLGLLITNHIRGDSTLNKYNRFIDGYVLRDRDLEACQRYYGIQIKEYYFKSVIFMVAKYADGSKKLLFSIRDKGPMMNRVGLYTEELYIINIFERIFDDIWMIH